MTSRQRISFCKPFCYIVVLAVLLFSTTNVWSSGIPIGIKDFHDPGSPMPETVHESTHSLTGGYMVMVGDISSPIDIYLDPTMPGAMWPKKFLVDIDGVGISPGDTVTVMEFIAIHAPPPSSGLPIEPITDWHESIHSDDWVWAGHSMVEFLPTTTTGFPGGTSTDGKEIWFDFPPMFPSPTEPLLMKITKDLVWTGGVITGSDPDSIIEIEVWERATTPEPSSFVLVALGVAGLGWFRWKKRSK